MSLKLGLSEAALSAESQRRIDDICARFEAEWKTGTQPRLEDFLADSPPEEHRELLQELLSLDEYYRRRHLGDAPSDHDYLAQYPDHAETIRDYFSARSGAAPDRHLPSVPGFKIERELGRGGMGVVYLALQDQPRRHVVLKMIRDGALAHPAAIRRFHIESEAVARLQHSNIVQVYAVGEHEGRPFMVLEYVAGGGLDRRLSGKPFDPREAAMLVEQLAGAVHYAHQQGVIHRDLKPANVLVVSDQSSVVSEKNGDSSLTTDHWPLTTLKIADFGLAKLLEDELGPLTMTGETVGTPSYMAPEQARGQSQDVGPATDVFALGAILYQLLTGRPPFLGPNAVTTLEQVTNHDPVPPRQLQPQVSRDLNTICLKCLEKLPTQRYGSALELAEDLRRFLSGTPIQARAISAAERVIRWSRRYPAAAALIALLCLGLAMTTAFIVRLDRAKKNEQLAKEKSDANLKNAQESIRKSLLFLVEDEEMVRKGLYDLRLRVLSTVTEQAEGIRSQSDDKTLMAKELAAAYQRIAALQQQLGQLSKTGQSIETAMNLYEVLLAAEPHNAEAQTGLASCYYSRGAYHRNEYRVEQSRADFRQSVGRLRQVLSNHPDNLLARRKLTDALVASGDQEQIAKDYARSDSFYHEALASAQDWAALQPTDGKALISQAKSYLGMSENVLNVAQDNQMEKATVLVRQAGAAMNGAFNIQTDDTSHRLSISITYLALSRPAITCNLLDDAEMYLRRAAINLERLCVDFPAAQAYRLYLSQCYFRLGNLFRSRGQTADEEVARRKSFEQVENLANAGPITLAMQQRSGVMSMTRYSIAYFIRTKKLDEAMPLIDRGERINELIFNAASLKSQDDNRSIEDAQKAARSAHLSWECQFEMDRAMVHDAAGRFRDSVAAWDKSMTLHTAFRNMQRVGRALALAGAGDFPSALAQAREVSTEKQLGQGECYDLARAFARCCRADALADQREVLGKAAVEFLNKAKAKGYFDMPDALESLNTDPDLKALRSRPDFDALRKSVADNRGS